MKKRYFFSIFLGIIFIISCASDKEEISTEIINNPNTAMDNSNEGNSGENIISENVPIMKFTEEIYDFGTITQGEKVYHSYTFKNTGNANLVITSASGSCGCTVPKYPKKPIPPGGEEKIEVVFDSDGKEGQQHKQVTIVANTQPNTNVIAIKGTVIAPKTN